MNKDEVVKTLSFLPPHSGRKLMVGVLGSYKTLFQGLKNKWPNRYPDKDDIADIFIDHPRALNLIHYNTDHRDTLVDQLADVIRIGGPHLHGFQLNVAWPTPNQIREFKDAFPDQIIVLQIGSKAFLNADGSEMLPRELAITVNNYTGVDYVLLDKSGGYGTVLGDDMLRFVSAFYDTSDREYIKAMVGIAGGLSADTMESAATILSTYPEVSIDAEGRLRNADDHLDLEAVRQYIEAALRVYSDPVPQW